LGEALTASDIGINKTLDKLHNLVDNICNSTGSVRFASDIIEGDGRTGQL
jgi:hypothetical protein